jgi:histidinol-phosphate/aromatic aminotransferase/cobyric acid decarboxylase-like protein
VEKSRGPYKINAIAERAAIAALTEDREWVRQRIDEVKQLRERFIGELQRMGLKPLRSDSNFVLVPVPDALKTGRALRDLGVAVRPFPSLPFDGDALRISVGPWSMMEPALEALARVLR